MTRRFGGFLTSEEPSLQIPHAFSNAIENAAVLFQPGQPLLGCGRFPTEHPFKHHARVDLHRQRL